MDRREYLGILGTMGIGTLTGCAGESDTDSEDTTTTTDAETATTTVAETTEDQTTTTTSEETTTEEDTTTEEETTEEPDPAAFEIVSVDHPSTVEVGEAHRFSITVKNTGEQPGEYRELLEASQEGLDEWENIGYVEVSDIEPGATKTWETDEFSYSEPGTIQFRIGDTEWSYDVEITAPDPQSFAGSGQEVREGVEIQGGLTVVDATHNGESNFQVSLAGDSDFDTHFINVIGDFDGAQAELVDAGTYILDVNADGNWDITIRQPRSGQGEALPVSFSGNGPAVVGPVRFSGTGVASGTHTGDSNFQVQIFPMTGTFPEVVFNEIGDVDAETTYSFDAIGWIDINADGNWTLEFD